MSVTAVASARPAGRVALRLRRVGLLLCLLIGSVVASALSPSHAAPTRIPKCPACANEAVTVTRLANLLEQRKTKLDKTARELEVARAAARQASAEGSRLHNEWWASLKAGRFGETPEKARLREGDDKSRKARESVQALEV